MFIFFLLLTVAAGVGVRVQSWLLGDKPSSVVTSSLGQIHIVFFLR